MGIELKQVCYNYKDKETLHELDLTIQTGESIGIIGASGCGKSTLLKLIAGLYTPFNGSILVAGETIPEMIQKKVAIVMQNSLLFPATIRDNITCGHPMSEEWLQYVCTAAQLNEWINSLPEGIDTFLGERANELSGGQAQRIVIARAIAKNAEVILLDEATSALDQDTSEAVLEALKELTKGKTVIHVTHRLESLVHCNRVYAMEGGRLYDKFNEKTSTIL